MRQVYLWKFLWEGHAINLMDRTANTYAQKPTRWLIERSRTAWHWIALSVGLGVPHGFLVILQVRCIARIIRGTVLEGVHRTDQTWLFTLLLDLVGLRAVLRWGREIAGFQAGARIREEVQIVLLERISSFGLAFIGREKVGGLASTVTEQVEGLHGRTGVGPRWTPGN